MTNYSVATLAELKTALTSSATNNQADVITLTADLAATSGADFTAGTGGNNLLKIAVTDGMTLSIVGGGHTLDANYLGRALEVSSGTVSISNLTIREGGLAGNGGEAAQAGGSALGAGIYNRGDLTLTNVTVTANAASGGGGGGGVSGNTYAGGGGGGGGLGAFAGAGGGGFGFQYYFSAGSAASAGQGGEGGPGISGYTDLGGRGGGVSGGARGGYFGQGYGGGGGTATVGGLSLGGGGGGGGMGGPAGAGGAAVGGIYNSGTLVLSGGAVTGNLAAGGGGGGTHINRAAPGGAAVGGVQSTGTLTLIDASITGNAATGGLGGRANGSSPGGGVGPAGSATNDRLGVVNHAPTGGVSIEGSPNQGQTLTASHTLADADGLGTISYQWESDGVNIGGATASTFVLTQAQVGHVVTVAASYTDGAAKSESVTSTATASVAGLQADPTPPTPPPEPVVTTVDGAAVSTRVTTAADGGQTHTILVTPVAAGGADVPLVSDQGVELIAIGLPAGAGAHASGSMAPGTASAATPVLTGAIGQTGSIGEQAQMSAGLAAFLQTQGGASVVAQVITVSGAPADTPIAFTGSPLEGGAVTALVIDTHSLPGQTAITLDHIDFAAIIGAVRITGGEGAQTVFADGAAQYMLLGAGDDALHGGGGDDTVGSAGGDDAIFGDVGEDQVFGGIGLDTVAGGLGEDWVHGNQGDDLVHGNAGNDLVYGGQGDDFVYGGQGEDQLWGDFGNDVLFGDLGNDILTGGAGADTFVFGPGGGSDRITDFRQAEGDHIQLSAGHGAYVTSQVGADTVLDFGGGQSLVLANVQLASLTDGWLAA